MFSAPARMRRPILVISEGWNGAPKRSAQKLAMAFSPSALALASNSLWRASSRRPG
jgi:hypothetical protein